MKNRENGKFLVWFCDRIYAVGNLFGATIESEYYVNRLPEIVAGMYEIRNARLKMEQIYGKVVGIDVCLTNIDHVLYRTEKAIWKGEMDNEELLRCKKAFYECAGELAGIWDREYFPAVAGQRRLDEAHALTAAAFCLGTLPSMPSIFPCIALSRSTDFFRSKVI